MLKLAGLIENPGEPPIETRYRDPRELAALGYNALAIYETTAISGLASIDAVDDDELRRWVGAHLEQIGRTIEAAAGAGLAVYLFYDMLVLPAASVQRHAREWTCRNARGRVLCPASERAIEQSVTALRAMLDRWPAVAGVVLRFGDTDAHRLPHLAGNDIYGPHCPRCRDRPAAERVVDVVERCHQLVVAELGKRLIVRAWNVRPGGLHDSPELARQVVQRLPGEPTDDRLVLSFKFTHTDFWRYQQWNPVSLACGWRPILYELQCQREFEGKGGVPNWQAPLWRDGYPETREQTDVAGLARLGERVNLAGVWAWVRGGGWGGPFVEHETWIDANVHAAPHLAEDLGCDVHALAGDWLRDRVGVSNDALAERLLAILEHSPQVVRQLFYIEPLAQGRDDPWHPNGDWIQDDLLDAQAAWRIVQRLPERQLDAAVQEKQQAATQLAADRAALQRLAGEAASSTVEPLVNTLVYAESLCQTLRDLLAALVAYRRFQKSASADQARIAQQKVLAAQSHWNHHTQRHGSLPGAATSFREVHFWELTQQILVEVSEVQA